MEPGRDNMSPESLLSKRLLTYPSRPASVGLNRGGVGINSAPMRQGPLARLRAFVLLIAFGIGLAGQAVASPLMPMAQNDSPRLTVPMGGWSACAAAARAASDQG